jgi:hypothetical protein
MADTFTNDLRLRLQESGANSGQWGSLLNDTLTNIASAFSLGSEAIPNASTHTITLADDSSSQDEARSLYLKCTGGGQACTVTLAPNTVSKVWIISNETSFTLTFSAGSGANVAVSAGAVKVIVTDGAGSGAAVVDALSGLDASLSGLTVDTTTLVVDATNNRVGIGTSSPSAKFHVAGSPQATSGALAFLRNSDATASNTTFGGVLFSSSPGTDFSIGKSNVNASTSLSFRNGNTGASLMELDSSGRLLVGKTSAGDYVTGFEVQPAGAVLAYRTAGVASIFGRTNDGEITRFTVNSAIKGQIATTTSAGGSRLAIGGESDPGIIFAGTGIFPASGVTASDNTADLGSSSYRWKNLYLSGGAYLGGTGAANYLDDYEEGTWTPTAVTGHSGFSAIQSARYTKIGNLVHIQFYATGITGTTSALLMIGGLPFTCRVNGWAPGSMNYAGTAMNNPHPRARAGETRLDFKRNGDDTISGTNITGHVIFQLTYKTDN